MVPERLERQRQDHAGSYRLRQGIRYKCTSNAFSLPSAGEEMRWFVLLVLSSHDSHESLGVKEIWHETNHQKNYQLQLLFR